MKQIFDIPTLIFDEANGNYTPRLLKDYLKRGWDAGLTPDDLFLLDAGLVTCGAAQESCEYLRERNEIFHDIEDTLYANCAITGPDNVTYTIALENGALWFIPPDWTWSEKNGWYVPDHCETCRKYASCDAQGHATRMMCEEHKVHCEIFPEEPCDDCENCDAWREKYGEGM